MNRRRLAMTHGTYEPTLVVVSVVIAAFASYTALDLANSVTVTRGRARAFWLAGGSLAMGVGIWSMHFIGMLAFRLPHTLIAYDVPLLILSIVVAILASATALYVVSRPAVTVLPIVFGGLAMGGAICGMHYLGVASMRMPATIAWNPRLVAASMVIAGGAAFAALWLAYRFRNEGGQRGVRGRILGGIVMGIAIAGMHYTAMAGMQFVHIHRPAVIDRDGVLATDGLAIAVTLTSVLVLVMALIGSVVQRELLHRSGMVAENARLFHEAERRVREEEALRRATEAFANAFTQEELLAEIARSAVETTGAHSGTIERALALESDDRTIAVPLVDDALLGVLVLKRTSDEPPFQPDEITRAETLRQVASMALRRVRLMEEADRRREQLAQSERQASLGRLAFTIAHEFNNVLMAIRAFNDVSRSVGTFEQFIKTAPQVDRAIERGKRITEAVLRLTHASEPVLVPLDLQHWLDALDTDLRSLLPSSIDLRISCDATMFVWADSNHLQQVFVNLALNARDAMPDGGTLSITARDDVVIDVHDTGIGMPAEVLQRIFEPLYTTRRDGTGLGLAIAWEIVAAHGGTITVDSVPGSGTTFHISLRAAPPPDAAGIAPAATSRHRGRRILLVEDDDIVAEGLCLMLQLSDLDVNRVATGHEALAAIASFDPHAVVLDVGLPDLDGVSVYRQLQARNPHMPVVFATGHGDEAVLAEFTNRPEVVFLRKPFGTDALVQAIESVMAVQA